MTLNDLIALARQLGLRAQVNVVCFDVVCMLRLFGFVAHTAAYFYVQILCISFYAESLSNTSNSCFR